MTEARLIRQDEIREEVVRRGYFSDRRLGPPPAVVPPGEEPPPPGLLPGEEPPLPELPPDIVPSVEKQPRAWLWLALGLVVASMGIQE